MCGGVRLAFVGRRLWLGTERSDLLVVGFYDLRRGAALLVLSVGKCSICRGGGAFSLVFIFWVGSCVVVFGSCLLAGDCGWALSGLICWR